MLGCIKFWLLKVADFKIFNSKDAKRNCVDSTLTSLHKKSSITLKTLYMLLPRSRALPRPGLVIRDPVLRHETRSKIFLSFSKNSPLLGWRFSLHHVRCHLNFYAGFIASGMRIYLKLFYVYKCFMIFYSINTS